MNLELFASEYFSHLLARAAYFFELGVALTSFFVSVAAATAKRANAGIDRDSVLFMISAR